MKNKTKLFRALLLSLALVVCICMLFTGCGDDEETPDTPSTDSSTPGSSTPAACTHEGGTATCTAKAKCSKCGEEYGELLAHDYADATCTVAKTCKNCSATEGEALGHDEIDDVVAPTCTEAGITNITCSRCDYTSTKDPVEALGHDEQYDVIAPTCCEDGITNVTCSRCDYTNTKDPTPATNEHKYDVKGETVAPTCTEAGYTVYGCSAGNCGTTSNLDPVAALGHDEQYEVIAPTCCEDGITNITCSRCDYTNTKDPTEATNEHNYDVKGETVAPTCSEEGYTVYGCSAGNCGTTENKDYTRRAAHNLISVDKYGEDFGEVACMTCGQSYINKDTHTSDSGSLCLGCGQDECICDVQVEWNGYVTPDPEVLEAGESKTLGGEDVTGFDKGLIKIESAEEATLTIYVNGDMYTVNGTELIVDLYSYDTIETVTIETTAEAVYVIYKKL